MKIINKKNNIYSTNSDEDFIYYLDQNIKIDDVLILDKSILKLTIIKNITKNYKKRIMVIEASEKIKTLFQYTKLIEGILKMGVNRNSIIYSFGGGTIGDLSGFAASTLLRGIGHVMIPTTLLAMVDSSIGGKTGINSSIGKNLIGTFYLPNAVIINSNFLRSLPKREISCGYAEIIKYALIDNNNLLKILNNSSDDYINNDYINDIINKSIKTKIKYIKDFKEKNIGKYSRAILNFGHTFGHAVESLNFNKGNIKHGEAVAIGMMFEIKISKLLNLKPISIVNLEGLLKKYNLPFDYRPYINNKNINNIMKKVYSDKKSFKDNTNLVLIKRNTGIVKNISLKKLKSITLELIK